MATASQWIGGSRPRTLPAAFAPVIVGTGLAASAKSFNGWAALLALIVAVALQVGVNYSNDYSDGIRGTDEARVGPVRLVGQGLAPAGEVKRAAFLSFAVAMLAGLGLVLLTQKWWLLLVGLACVAAAWLYTGGKHPYGYLGLGEIFVFVFFGLVPVVGTFYVQALTVTTSSVIAACGVGFLSCAILVTNNLRDIPGDTVSGKRTLAVRLGDSRTRALYLALVIGAAICVVVLTVTYSKSAVLALASFALAVTPVRIVMSGKMRTNGNQKRTVLNAASTTVTSEAAWFKKETPE
jgi:1,4-dihydroxy-2-naphthoate octaprenyltransferase